jgi:hypothetical protein
VTDFEGLLRQLRDAEVQFIIVGGFAGTVLGSPRTTVDLDVVYARDAANLERLARALEPLLPYLRGAPPGLPFRPHFGSLEPAEVKRLRQFERKTNRLKRWSPTAIWSSGEVHSI